MKESEKRTPIEATPELLSEMENLVIRGGSTASPLDTHVFCDGANCVENCGTKCTIACKYEPISYSATNCGVTAKFSNC